MELFHETHRCPNMDGLNESVDDQTPESYHPNTTKFKSTLTQLRNGSMKDNQLQRETHKRHGIPDTTDFRGRLMK